MNERGHYGSARGVQQTLDVRLDEVSRKLQKRIEENAFDDSLLPDPTVPCVDRRICFRARVSDLPAGSSIHVSVYDDIRKTSSPLGELVSTRHVGPFVIRLVRAHEEVWRVIETDSRNQKVILLTYDSKGPRAREDATRYAATATKTDLTSDFDPGAHFFGERRIPRGTSR